MKFALLALQLVLATFAAAAESDAWIPLEKQVAEVTAGSKVTIVHFWAPWCPNCQAELAKHGWRDFLAVNREVNVIFVTIWSPEEGRADLAKYGLAEQANFQLFHHPNGARAKAERVTHFLGQPIDWIPTTWVFKDGKLRFALNYGEVRFPLLQQLVRDASESWDHPKPAAETPAAKL